MDKLRTTLSFGKILTEHDIETFMSAFSKRILKANAFMKKNGTVSSEIAFVDRGILRIFNLTDSGSEVTKYFARSGQFIAELESYYSGIPTDEAIQAVIDTEIFVIKKSVIDKLCAQIPTLYLFLKSMTESTLLNKLKDNDFLNYGNAETKYMEFVKRYPELALHVPQQMIASYLKITPQSLSRIRKNIK